jgi:hypothetical protein
MSEKSGKNILKASALKEGEVGEGGGGAQGRGTPRLRSRYDAKRLRTWSEFL